MPGLFRPTGERELVAAGRHKAEPARRTLPRLPRVAVRAPQAVRRAPHLVRQAPRPVVAGGVAAATLAGATLAVVAWPDAGPADAVRVVAAPAPSPTASAGAADAAAALRLPQRPSRALPRSAEVPAAPRPATASPKPMPKKTALPKVVARLWAETAVNVRSGPSTDAARIDTLAALARVGVTGATRDGWTQVVVDGRAGWVRSSYLSRTKPAPAPKRTAPGISDAPCSISTSIEKHLSSNARAVYRAVCAAYGGSVSSFGGYRAGDDGDHGSGRAVDIMVSGAPGWDIARYVQKNARALGVTYVIYEQKIWMAGDPFDRWKAMEDRGSRTANHYDHVHVSVS